MSVFKVKLVLKALPVQTKQTMQFSFIKKLESNKKKSKFKLFASRFLNILYLKHALCDATFSSGTHLNHGRRSQVLLWHVVVWNPPKLQLHCTRHHRNRLRHLC